MKSGPSLNGCTVNPSRRIARISASVTVVLPTPLCVPATMKAWLLMPGGIVSPAARWRLLRVRVGNDAFAQSHQRSFLTPQDGRFVLFAVCGAFVATVVGY